MASLRPFSLLLLGAVGAVPVRPGEAQRSRLERFEPGPPGFHAAGFDSALLDPLDAYVEVRSAGFAGWADTGIYIGTRFGRFPQLHRVAAPGADRRQLTFFSRRVSSFAVNPVPARRFFLYTQDEGGDERFQLRGYDLARGAIRNLGMPPGRADGVVWNDSGTAFAYAHVPAGTDRWDVRMGRPDGSDTLLLSLPGTWSPMDFRPDGKRILLQKYVSAAEARLYALDLPGGALTLLAPGPAAFVDDAAWVRRGRNPRDTVWEAVFTSDRDGEAHRLYRLSLEGAIPDPDAPSSGAGNGSRPRFRTAAAPAPVSSEGPWDVEWVSVAPDRRTVAWSLNEDGYSRLRVLVPGAKEAKALSGGPRGILSEARFRRGDRPREFAVTATGGNMPGDVWVCDWTRDKWTRWTFSETGGLPESAFREAESLRYPGPGNDPDPVLIPKRSAADRVNGAGVPALLYRPDSAAFPGRRPVVIQIHGGPEMQARPGFDPFVQYLAGTLGYAVILPNVRGSSGYGKSWLKADDGYRRMAAVRDIGALLDWIAAQPYLDSGKAAVSGRSYGGFMSLASLVEYGPRLAAGISGVGISHFPSFLRNTSGYRRDLRRAEYGDERDPRMAAFLDSISPLTRAGSIRTPLLLIHGRNDPRVPYGESEAIFRALKAHKTPAWFLTFEEEGHGTRDPDDQKEQWRIQAGFLIGRLGAPPAPPPR